MNLSLFFYIVVPSVLAFSARLPLASSFFLGTASSIIIAFCVSIKKIYALPFSISIVSLIVAFLLSSLALSSIFDSPSLPNSFSYSVYTILLILASYVLAEFSLNKLELPSSISPYFTWTLILLSIPFVSLIPTFPAVPREFLFYAEISHYILGVMPIFLFTFLGVSIPRKFFLLSILLILVVVYNTLIGIVFLATCLFLMIFLEGSFFLACLPFGFLLIAVPLMYQLRSDYISSRLLVSNVSSNLSALAYAYGWESLFYTLVHYPFGIGIGNMSEFLFPATSLDTINSFNLDSVSSSDGSFAAAKIICETGYPGLVLVGFATLNAIWLFLTSIVNLRIARDSRVYMFEISLSVTFLFYTFIRFAGYLNLYAFVAALLLVYNLRYSRRSRADTLN